MRLKATQGSSLNDMYDVAVVMGAGPGDSNAAAVLLRGGRCSPAVRSPSDFAPHL